MCTQAWLSLSVCEPVCVMGDEVPVLDCRFIIIPDGEISSLVVWVWLLMPGNVIAARLVWSGLLVYFTAQCLSD